MTRSFDAWLGYQHRRPFDRLGRPGAGAPRAQVRGAGLALDELVLVSLLVLLETEWMLCSRYGFKRDAILDIFRALLAARELAFEDEPALEEALYRWPDVPANFQTA